MSSLSAPLRNRNCVCARKRCKEYIPAMILLSTDEQLRAAKAGGFQSKTPELWHRHSKEPPDYKSSWLVALANTFVHLPFLPASPFTDPRATEKPLPRPFWLL